MAGIGHIAVGLAAGRYQSPQKPLRAMVILAVAALLPDADVVAFALGIPYASPFGHRGTSHALLVAPLLAILPARLIDKTWRSYLLTTAVVASHGLLDALTDGGLGAALLWPFTAERFFCPWRPLPVSPVGARVLSARGLHVALTEILWFVPFVAYALWPRKRPR